MKIYKDGNFICLDVTRGFTYDIHIEQIKSEGLENWVNHLEEKNWFGPVERSQFIKLVEQDYGQRTIT